MSLECYESLWMIDAFESATGRTFTVDNINDLPFIDAKTAEQWCITWGKEFPHLQYKAVRYVRCEEKEKVQ